MISAILNLTIEAGADWVRGFQWSDENLSPLADISTWTVSFEILDSPNGTVLYSKTQDDAEITVVGTQSYLEVNISDSDIDTFTFTHAWYQLILTNGSGQSFKLVSGSINLEWG